MFRQQQQPLDFVSLLLGGAGNAPAQPQPEMKPPAPRGRGLFTGGPRTTAPAIDIRSVVEPQQPRRYGIADRIYDAGAIYAGAPTRADAFRQQAERDEQRGFGAQFGKLLGEADPAEGETRYRQMQQLIAQRAAQGGDVSAFSDLASAFRTQGLTDALASSLPDNLRTAGRFSPQTAVGYQFDQNAAGIYPGTDGDYLRGAKGGGDFSVAYDAPLPTPEGFMPDPQDPSALAPRRGGPQDPGYLYDRQYQGTAGAVAATPPDPAPLLTESNIVAQVMLKAQSGLPLNAAEQAIFDRQVTIPQAANPFAFMGMAPGGPSPYGGQAPQAGAPQGGRGGADPLASIREGQVVVQDGVRYVKRNGQMVPAN